METGPAGDSPRTLGSASGSPAAPEPSLEHLLKRASVGDEIAFARLYDVLAARVYGLVARVVRDRAQSEEVTQEVFVEVWRQSARFDPDRGSVISWVMMLAHRRAVDRVRSSEASRQRDGAYEVRNSDRETDVTVEAVERTLDRERVTRALAGLTEVQRTAIELAYFGGYTHQEIASMLDLPLGTAKTRIRDGLIRLRDALGMAA